MRVSYLSFLALLCFVSHGSGTVLPSRVQNAASSSGNERLTDLVARANPPLRLPTADHNAIAQLLNLTAVASSLKTDLIESGSFQFRVPRTTIELRVKPSNRIDSRTLGNELLRLHEYLNDEIEAKGDGTLAPTDDPFIWAPTGPPRSGQKLPGRLLSQYAIALAAQSVKGKEMTWSTLLIAVEGLYLCLPAAGKNTGAKFQIWDYKAQAQWGFGVLESVP